MRKLGIRRFKPLPKKNKEPEFKDFHVKKGKRCPIDGDIADCNHVHAGVIQCRECGEFQRQPNQTRLRCPICGDVDPRRVRWFYVGVKL